MSRDPDRREGAAGPEALDCRDVRPKLLAAPSEFLRGAGTGEGPVARHLGECGPCRDVARVLLEGQARLDGALTGLAEASSADALLGAVRKVLSGDGLRQQSGFEARSGSRPREVTDARAGHSRSTVPWVAGASLLAAAALAGLLLLGRGDAGLQSGPGTAPSARSDDLDTGTDAVEVQSQRRFALMKTDDPTISVVWFY